MKRIAGTFNGTGAELIIGIGFVPDWVIVQNMEDSDVARLIWSKHMLRAAEMVEGVLHYTAAGLLGDPRTVSDGGIRRYFGGDTMTAASTVYLTKDEADYRTSDDYGTINAWTLDTSADRTGSFNVEADTTYVGEGSPIIIDGDEYFIVSLTSNGEQDDEVTLNEAVSSGNIYFIGNMYDYTGAALDEIIPAGFKIEATSLINVSGEMCMFEAGMYDN